LGLGRGLRHEQGQLGLTLCDPMEWILAICTGITLSAACGLRVFAPFFVLSLASKFFGISVPDGLIWLSSWTAFVCLCVAMVVEVAGCYIPWIDNALDVISTPLALIGGALMMGGTLGEVPAYMRWSLAVIFGSGAAGAVQVGTELARAFNSVTTGGSADNVVTTGENVGAVSVTLLGVILPIVGLIVAAALGAVLAWLCCRRSRDERTVAVLP